MNHATPHTAQLALVPAPDCIRCLRKKLSADGAAVFTLADAKWYLSDFEADIPQEDAEFQFVHLLKIGVPNIIHRESDGILLNSDAAIQAKFPGINQLLTGCSVVASKVAYGTRQGVRLVWRDAAAPFTSEDLQTLVCHGECPPDCV